MSNNQSVNNFSEAELASEQWKVVKDFPEYQVSTLGRVKSKYGYLSATNAKGYRRVNLKTNLGRKSKLVHRLVCEAFIPNPNNYTEINHIDGNKANNRVENLEWCTHEYNMQHAAKTGLIPSGVNKKLSPDQEKELIYDFLNDMEISELAEKYQIGKRTVSTYLTGIYKYKPLLPEERERIKSLYDTGLYSYCELGKIFKVSHKTIKKVITGKR